MRLPLPHMALVQVTWSSSVFWRHLQQEPQATEHKQQDQQQQVGAYSTAMHSTALHSTAGENRA
jgi:hypothetical protein